VISLSNAFDLGLDRTRMKNPEDAARQHATAEALLKRLYHSDGRRRWEVQILADEVGMGKTFVALAVAFSLLERLKGEGEPPDLEGCYQKVVILGPPNESLLRKWEREVSEFVGRDDFVTALSKRGKHAPRVIVASMTVFGPRKLQLYEVKRRFLLSALFRYWGTAFRYDRRERLLRGAPASWGGSLEVDEAHRSEIPCSEDDAVEALGRLDRPSQDGEPSRIAQLLESCREISEPYVRERVRLFDHVTAELNWIYREMLLKLLRSPVPLVIVDEAHNWKNGPEHGTNGYDLFAEHLASRTRRALLLTATPFQLRPGEMLEILRIGEALRPASDRATADARRERLRKHREEVLRTVLDHAVHSSRRFARAWAKLPALGPGSVAALWSSASLVEARTTLAELSAAPGAVDLAEVERVAASATSQLEPAVRSFFAEALRLYAHNRDLSREMGQFVVRHRRKTDHRIVRSGEEYEDSRLADERADRHVLHVAPGMNVTGEGELPHYLLMRCVSEANRHRGRSSLGSALTGCYSTLLESAEGKKVKEWLASNPDSARHFRLLLEMVDRRHDPRHPKLAAVVERALAAWHEGEKTLIFCFRTNTAERLRDVLHDRISRELRDRRKRCLGGEAALKALRGRVTRRDGDLAPLGLDRVLWSLSMCSGGALGEWPFLPAELELEPGDLPALARAYLRHGMSLDEERTDRVFLQRAIEHAIAARLVRGGASGLVKGALRLIASSEWVERPYGVAYADEPEGSDEGEAVAMRGVHTLYPVVDEDPAPARVEAVARRLAERRERAQRTGDVSVLDVPARGPSLWFGGPPSQLPEHLHPVVRRVHEHLAALTVRDGDLDWAERLHACEALWRALLRDSVLVRLLPSRSERHEKAWGELLVDALWKPLPRQREGMGHRVEVFLEDLCAASGRHDQEGSARGTLLDATKLRDQRFVALVKGGDPKGRERAFAGFNTPLLPDILVCTSVGSEGIDLHRHCRFVVHYDLAWNPAVLEQRTGRVDRIGSKTFRERALNPSGDAPFLDVGIPFLAGTYDERMYEELRLRAQVFEVLTGGDVATDDAGGDDSGPRAEGTEEGLRYVALPEQLVSDLRVRLHVWAQAPTPAEHRPPDAAIRSAAV
jgi:hypothetical protein